MHELCAGEVGRVRGAGQQQEQGDDPDRMQHRIGERMALRLERHRIRDRIDE
jgi:hypothetical protein